MNLEGCITKQSLSIVEQYCEQREKFALEVDDDSVPCSVGLNELRALITSAKELDRALESMGSMRSRLTIANNQIECAYNRMCPCCASRAVVKRTEVSQIPFGDPPMRISVTQQITKCADCGEEWIYSSDSGAIDEGVAAHLLALTKTQAARIAELEAELAAVRR